MREYISAILGLLSKDNENGLSRQERARVIYFYLAGFTPEQALQELERGFIISQEEEHIVELITAMGETPSEQRATLKGYLIAHNERAGNLEALIEEYKAEPLEEAKDWAEELELLRERERKILALSEELERESISI